jgi:Flp pilus assembly protein TadG
VSPDPDTEADAGSAVVEFVLVSILVVVLVLAVLQVAVALHIRNTLISASSEGARFAAASDREPEDGAQHTRELIVTSLPDEFASDVSGRYVDVQGVSTIEVEIRADLPVFGWFGPSDSLTVRGHAMEES